MIIIPPYWIKTCFLVCLMSYNPRDIALVKGSQNKMVELIAEGFDISSLDSLSNNDLHEICKRLDFTTLSRQVMITLNEENVIKLINYQSKLISIVSKPIKLQYIFCLFVRSTFFLKSNLSSFLHQREETCPPAKPIIYADMQF